MSGRLALIVQMIAAARAQGREVIVVRPEDMKGDVRGIPGKGPTFVVFDDLATLRPLDDVRWCEALAAALTGNCLCPTPVKINEVRDLLANRPAQALPESWAELARQAEAWSAKVDAARWWDAPAFPGLRQISLALRDKPLPVPAWAARERAAMFDDAEGRN